MKRLSNDLRTRVIQYYFKEKCTLRQTGKIFSISHSTVSRWLLLYDQKLLYCQKPRPKRQIIEILQGLIEKYVIKNPLTTLRKISKYLRKTGFIRSISSISRYLKRLKISYKKVKRTYSPDDPVREIQKSDFRKRVHSLENVYCLDETGFYLENFPYYGWSRKGFPCLFKSTKKPTREKYSMIMVISKQGIEAWKLYKSGTTREIMKSFVSELKPVKGYMLMDNLNVHHNKEIIEILSKKYLQPIYTITYSPELNPIEEVFSVIKRYIRQKLVSGYDCLKSSLEKIIQKLNKLLNFENFYNHAFE